MWSHKEEKRRVLDKDFTRRSSSVYQHAPKIETRKLPYWQKSWSPCANQASFN